METRLTDLTQLRETAQAAKGLIAQVAGVAAEAIGELAEAKQDVLTGLPGQVVGFDENGEATAVDGMGGAGVSFPSGGIIIWSGAAGAIPEGWALCDGENGTPDLRDRFVLGAGSKYGVGAKGGEETVTLTVEQMPSHSHKEAAYVGLSGNTVVGFIRGNKDLSAYVYTYSTGGGQAHNNMPPYYALCYIMKL